MTTPEKIIARLFFFCIIVIPIALGIHYAAFPEETKSILVDSQGYEEKGRIYYEENTAKEKIDALQLKIDSASARVAAFWGEKLSDPDYIFLEDSAAYAGYCKTDAPAVTYLKLGVHIVLSKYASDVDILAHEISHGELFERVGFFKWTFEIPTWFKQGLAMQNDHRKYYSEDTLKMLTANLTAIGDIKNYTSDESFYYGSEEEVRLHYMLAKQELKTWYTKEKLQLFLVMINDGRSFYEAYNLGVMPAETMEEAVKAIEAAAVEPAPEAAVPEPVPAEAPVKVKVKTEEEETSEDEVPSVEFKTSTPEDFVPKE